MFPHRHDNRQIQNRGKECLQDLCGPEEQKGAHGNAHNQQVRHQEVDEEVRRLAFQRMDRLQLFTGQRPSALAQDLALLSRPSFGMPHRAEIRYDMKGNQTCHNDGQPTVEVVRNRSDEDRHAVFCGGDRTVSLQQAGDIHCPTAQGNQRAYRSAARVQHIRQHLSRDFVFVR